ncbi:orcokinin peptides-like isoform X2 [Odontomachus brunneus]|uniref:orcokinin peptides-like isoform X2 n=1 Tax=Odontomachus brunneus TaxID=486640 RepID=UPI0013F19E5C|nr:orcokinin peptides-like isoform X2 [Odontomachus brunneus]
MTRGAFPSSSIAITVLIAALAAAGPVQLQTGPNVLQREEYGPSALADLLARYWEERSAASRNLNGVSSGNHLLRQTRRGLDSLSGATFGESKRLIPLRRVGPANVRPVNFDEIDRSVFDRFSKRNIDEIDTAFDSFFKRNFDEIDRVGWSGFVKRLDNYLADRQQGR